MVIHYGGRLPSLRKTQRSLIVSESWLQVFRWFSDLYGGRSHVSMGSLTDVQKTPSDFPSKYDLWISLQYPRKEFEGLGEEVDLKSQEFGIVRSLSRLHF